MNRNAAIGVVLVGVLLAAIAVGTATYMSKGSVDASAEALRSEMEASASDVVSEVDARISGIEETTIPKENGEAVNLAAVDTLWSKGRLTVTDADGVSLPIFEVDPAASRIVLGASTIEMGDFTAGALSSSGVITGEGFQTTSGGWAVDNAGDMRSGDLTVGGDTAISGILKVDGGEFRVGDGLVYDAGAKTLAVQGTVFATGIQTSGTGNIFEMYNDVQFDGTAFAKSGAWNIAQDGTAKFASLTAGAINCTTLAASGNATIGGTMTAASSNTTGDAAVGGKLTVVGDPLDVDSFTVGADGSVNMKSLSFGGVLFDTDVRGKDNTKDVVGRDITASRLLKSEGTLVVVGDTAAPDSSFWVDASGNANVNSLYINGVLVDPSVGSNLSKDVSARNITASGWITASGNVTGASLVSTGSLSVGGGDFAVDASGNATIAGTLDVTGDVSITGNLAATGAISASNLPNGIASGQDLSGAPVLVPGMPANAAVVVTPVTPTVNPYVVDSSTAGQFIIIGDPGLFNWIAVW